MFFIHDSMALRVSQLLQRPLLGRAGSSKVVQCGIRRGTGSLKAVGRHDFTRGSHTGEGEKWARPSLTTLARDWTVTVPSLQEHNGGQLHQRLLDCESAGAM